MRRLRAASSVTSGSQWPRRRNPLLRSPTSTRASSPPRSIPIKARGRWSCAPSSRCSKQRVVNSSQGASGRSMENESDLTARGAALLEQLKSAIAHAMVGQNAVIEQVIAALAASGHVLIEGVPGLGKTLLVRALAKALSLGHGRVQ